MTLSLKKLLVSLTLTVALSTSPVHSACFALLVPESSEASNSERRPPVINQLPALVQKTVCDFSKFAQEQPFWYPFLLPPTIGFIVTSAVLNRLDVNEMTSTTADLIRLAAAFVTFSPLLFKNSCSER